MHLSVILMVVIALLSILESVLLVWLAVEGRRTLLGVERMAGEMVDGLTPVASQLAQAAGNAAEVSAIALDHAQRLDAALGGAAEAWTNTAARLHDAVTPNIGRLAGVAAAWRVFHGGWRVYRFFRR